MNKQISDIIKEEEKRQTEGLEMIASENYTSPDVREALSCVFTHKYAEGYPGARYYGGTEPSDQLETLTQELALKVFGLDPEIWSVNVQPYSGSPANLAAYLAVTEPGDTLLGMSLNSGGHLTHGHKVSATGKIFNFIQYGLGSDGLINYQEIAKLSKENKPKVVVSGASAYPRKLDFKKFYDITQENQLLHMVDMSHIAGLVAGNQHPSPFEYADIVTTTTHKTLRGPRGALIFSRRELAGKINKAIFPGLQGGPHLNTIAGIAQALFEATKPEFKTYAKQVVLNMQAFVKTASKLGFKFVTDGTDNHLCLIDLSQGEITGADLTEKLEAVCITVNKNAIPNDPRPPKITSGVRVGSAALTTRGMTEKDFENIAKWFALVRDDKTNGLEEQVKELAKSYPLFSNS